MVAVLKRLSQTKSSFVCSVIDALLDEFLSTLRIDSPSFYQKRLALVKIIGELYNFDLISEHCFFDIVDCLFKVEFASSGSLVFFSNITKSACLLLKTSGRYLLNTPWAPVLARVVSVLDSSLSEIGISTSELAFDVRDLKNVALCQSNHL